MEERGTASPGYSTVALLIVLSAVLWLWFFRWQQRHRLGPKDWPLIGATIETLRHFDIMHDWLLSYFQKGLMTFRVRMPGVMYTYTVDPANVEYILKTNFSNFPKVINPLPLLGPSRLAHCSKIIPPHSTRRCQS